MSAPAHLHSPGYDRWSAGRWLPAVLIGAVTLATLAALVVGQGNPAIAILPVVLVSGAYLVTRLPLRLSAAGLVFLLLGPDMHLETQHQWRSPLAILGDVMHDRLDGMAGIPGMAITGMELALVFLFGVYVWRRATRQRIDGEAEPSAGVMRELILIYVAAVLVSDVIGMAQGHGLVPWKLRNMLHPIVLALFFMTVFRSRDALLVGRVIVASAVMRAIFVIIVQRVAIAETGGRYESGTGHGDSVLFALAVYVLVIDLLMRPSKNTLRSALIFLPLLLLACKWNERRLVWVMIGMMCAFTYFVAPMRGWKRTLTYAILAGFPLIVAYVAVGWNNASSRIFAPVQTLRSVADTSHDHSAYWREVEIWNIATSIRGNVILGRGLGGEYSETMMNDDISSIYKEYREWPHNTVLGLLMMMGVFGFTATWMMFPAVIYLALRVFRGAPDPMARVTAVVCMAGMVDCLVMAWGDTGAHYPQFKVVMALAMAFTAKLAVAHGVWPSRRAAA